MVLSACGLIYSTQEVTILREGKEKGRQAVFNVAETWIVRIFELHDGFRQSATFLWQVLTSLERDGAASERIRHHGILPATDFHYTVTKFVDGIPLTDELCSHPSVRHQVVSLFRAMWNLSVPSTVSTVEDYMRPRLEQLNSHLSFISPAVSQQVGTLASLPDFQGFRMVVSHCDMVPENIIGRLKPSVEISVIDWEFCNYVPEFHVAAQFGRKAGRQVWGDTFIRDIGYGPYTEQVVWTESLCMIAEDYGREDFEAQVLVALTSR
jgi:serine/threonine protein kinase